MRRVMPGMRDFAERLAALETKENQSSEKGPPAGFLVCEKLRPQLATLMGNTGFRALLSRALTLAHAEVPWLRAVQIKTDGSLDGLGESEAQMDSDLLSKGGVALASNLLGLLAAFIGESLTLRLVLEVWPKLPLNDLDFGKGDKNEKEK